MNDDDVKGFAFPFRIDPATGRVELKAGREKIRQNIRVILSTRRGERPMLRDFGTQIPALVHDPNDDVLGDIVQKQAREALLQWEPRVLVMDSTVEHFEGELRLRLSYIHANEPMKEDLIIPIT
ncbi:MAG: GPW/gp25 family protein [Acidobacteria bacterium]|nr:GPW/gp25 family protein [Acidobacteriota bacterium]